MDPILTVLLYSSIAVLAGGLGGFGLPGRRTPAAALGAANALAAGTMLGAAYLLAEAADPWPALPLALGAAAGIVVLHWTHRASGIAELDLGRLDDQDPVYGFQVLLVSGIHAAGEGVAIGAAMAVDLSLGVFMALAIALHNVPEGLALGAVFRARGHSRLAASGLAVTTDVQQVLFAVTLFAVAGAAPAILPWALGFASGALVQLVMVDLLPQSYRQAGHTSIALAAVAALGMVVLVGGLTR